MAVLPFIIVNFRPDRLRAEKEMIPAFLSLRRNGKRLPGQHDLAQEAERLLFAAVAQHGQHIEKLAARSGERTLQGKNSSLFFHHIPLRKIFPCFGQDFAGAGLNVIGGQREVSAVGAS